MMSHEQENVQALGNVENMRRALESLLQANGGRLSKVVEAAKEQAAGGGESDLRRLKRQFSSLKNTYMLYDTKEHFIDGLLDDLPDGSEERKLQDLEEHVRAQGANVKKLKQQNSKVQEEIAELIARICEDAKAFDGEHAAVLAVLDGLAAELAQGDPSAQEPPPPIDEGPSEDECKAQLAAAGDTARQLETSIAGDEGEAAELVAAIQSEEEGLQLLRIQAEQLQAGSAAAAANGQRQQQQGREAAVRAGAMLEWLRELSALISTLSGVAISDVAEDALVLTLTTHAEAPATQGATDKHSWQYELRLALQPGSAALRAVELAPPDMDISDIAAAAAGASRPLAFVVREVHARLAAHLNGAAGAGEAVA